MKVLTGSVFGVIVTTFWFGVYIPHHYLKNHAVVFEKNGDMYEVNMLSATPIVGIANNPFPEIKAVMKEDGQMEFTALLNTKVRLTCVMMVPQEKGFSATQFKDKQGQTWTRIDGRDPLSWRCYWGTITTDGKNVYFHESHYQG